jgi:FAD/FMN-containing dehydrogenase
VWQANEAGAKYGLALPLGICPDVGVSGLTLGGGVGYGPRGARHFFDPVHGAITRVRSDATSFPHRPQGAGVGIIPSWRDPAADKSWAKLHPYIPHAYVNMLEDEGVARVRESYGGNYERLRRLKTKYDPQNIFRSNQNILPA